MRIDKQVWIPLRALQLHFGCSKRFLINEIARGRLKAVRMGGRHYSDERPRKTDRRTYRVYVEDALAYLQRWRAGTRSVPSWMPRRYE